jgi:hypothetical protein
MDREILQNDVDRLVEWVKLWKMSFNNEKCKIMRIHSGRSQSVKNRIENSTKILMDYSNGTRHELIETHIERDLGIYINCNVKWADQINKATNKAFSVLGTLKRTFQHWDCFSFVKLFTA